LSNRIKYSIIMNRVLLKLIILTIKTRFSRSKGIYFILIKIKSSKWRVKTQKSSTKYKRVR